MIDYLDKYREAARKIKAGADRQTPVCWEFVCHVREDNGLSTPTLKDIVAAEMDIGPVAEDHKSLIIADPKAWSVILFECHQFDWHAGVVLPGLVRFIHLRREHGIEITDIDDRFWSKRCQGYYEN